MDNIDPVAVRKLFEENLGARAIAKKLGYQNHASVTKCLRRLGLRRRGPCLVEPTALHLNITTRKRLQLPMLRKAAEHFAVYYFTRLGFDVLIPNSAQEYDLMVDFPDEGLKKVQVKSSSFSAPSGNYEFALKKTRHNSKGSRVVFYTKEECDYFFLMDVNENAWLIPFKFLENTGSTVPALRYPGYKVR
jgi:hypothetical protein